MSDSCCGGCGGKAPGHKAPEEKPVLPEYKPEQGQKQQEKQGK